MACEQLLRVATLSVLLVAALLVLSSESKGFAATSAVDENPPKVPKKCEPECGRAGLGRLSKTPLRASALFSFMGSGNTWVRHLLTTASGLLTGVVYNSEYEVSTKGYESRRVIAVKTHRSPNDTRKQFVVDRTILIVRNPFEVFLTFFNYKGTYSNQSYKHVGVRPKEDFINEWPQRACSRCKAWVACNLEWIQETIPIYVIVYHRLMENLERELHKVFEFLNETSITPRIHCAVKDSEGSAHRQKPDWLEKLAVFPEDCRVRTNAAIDVIQQALEARTGLSFQDFQQWKR